MNKVISVLFIGLMFCAFVAVPVYAIPTFQVYSPQGIAGTIGPDENTWFVFGTSFDLIVVGNFQDSVTSLTSVTLVVSVPDMDPSLEPSGSITITGPGGVSLLTSTSQHTLGNPNSEADADILTDVGGIDGYETKEFLPQPMMTEDAEGNPISYNFNNHYPFQDGVSDFLLFELADFIDDGTYGPYGPVHDYNADDGEYDPTVTGGFGQERLYSVEFSGFEWIHIDVYGLADDAWRINPASHDTTAIPAPGALLLGSIGMGIVGWLRRRRRMM